MLIQAKAVEEIIMQESRRVRSTENVRPEEVILNIFQALVELEVQAEKGEQEFEMKIREIFPKRYAERFGYRDKGEDDVEIH